MNTFQRRILLVLVPLAMVSPALAVKLQLQSDPVGVTVQVIGPEDNLKRVKIPQGVTPFELDLPRSSTPYEIVWSKPGYEKVQTSVNSKTSPPLIKQTLAPLVVEKSISIKSDPEGAEVLVDGTVIGKAPVSHAFRFERATKIDAWKKFTVHIRKTEYQDEETTLAVDPLRPDDPEISMVLGRIAQTREIEAAALDEQGKVIPNVELYLDDKLVGKTDERGLGRASVPFTRKTKTVAWPEFGLMLVVRNEYQPVTKKIAITSDAKQEYHLVPVTEVAVKRNFPSTKMTAHGPKLDTDVTDPLGILNDRDMNSPAIDLRLVTNFDRKNTTQSLNSFTVTPDGKSIIYAVSGTADDGKLYSNLFIKGVQSSRSPVTQLTRGTHFLDSFPAMSGEEGSTLVVFQSNRGVPDTWNISAVRVDGGRVIGGVQQLTRDPRFNYGPTLASEHQPVFFSVVDDAPQAVARVASVRTDGTTFTNYGEAGESLHYASTGVLYLSRPDPQGEKQQVYSLAVEGQAFSTVLNDEQFTKANCSWPALSPSSDMLLFVSDYVADEKGRKNNNVFLWDTRRGSVLQLTDNGSDDIAPKWSPTEPGVIYFLSNRQGAYNVWRMSFRLAQ